MDFEMKRSELKEIIKEELHMALKEGRIEQIEDKLDDLEVDLKSILGNVLAFDETTSDTTLKTFIANFNKKAIAYVQLSREYAKLKDYRKQ